MLSDVCASDQKGSFRSRTVLKRRLWGLSSFQVSERIYVAMSLAMASSLISLNECQSWNKGLRGVEKKRPIGEFKCSMTRRAGSHLLLELRVLELQLISGFLFAKFQGPQRCFGNLD